MGYMKIKTITCHDVYNFGATLQAFALMKYLTNKGHNVEIINYKPEYLSKRYNLWQIGPRWSNKGLLVKLMYFAYKLPGRFLHMNWKGKYRFDIFKRKYMKISRQVYKSNKELKLNAPKADIFIAGSDQIWNTLYNNGRDPAFYLDFAPARAKKISYAASFSIDTVLPEYKFFVQTMIKKFDHISVRESKGIEILDSLGIKKGKHVMDPVFLLEREIWHEMANKKVRGNYILVYDFENNPIIERFVKQMAKKDGLKIYAVNNYKKTPYANNDYHNSGPELFLSLIKNAKYIASNSFHGTAFALIFEKEFFVFDRMKQNVNSRMRDLLHACELNDRLLQSESEFKKIYTPINYEIVNKKLNKHILNSKLFLDSSLT